MKQFLYICCICIICFSCVKQKEIIVGEDSEFLYVKKYTPGFKDTTFLKFNKPTYKYWNIFNKNRVRIYSPVRVGKMTTHRLLRYHYLYVENNKDTLKIKVDYNTYVNKNIGDSILLQHSFYPKETIKIVKNN